MSNPDINEDAVDPADTGDDSTRVANGPEQTPGVEGLGAEGSDETTGQAVDADPEDTRVGNGPVQTPGVEGLGSEGSAN